MKNKTVLRLILIIIIVIGTFLLFKVNSNQGKKLLNNNDLSNNESIIDNENNKYEYKSFSPLLKDSSNNGISYDFTQDMTYSNKIYYKKINTYEEYIEVKARWNNIIDMTEYDFKTNFMVITAIENTSMLGLTVDNLEVDNNGLYISLIHFKDDEEYNEKETCISYKISRELEKDNIYVTRNYLDSEKDFNTEMKLAVNPNNPNSFMYKTDIYNNTEEKNGMSIIQENWQDYLILNIEINKNTPEIDFSKWNRLGDDFYYISLDKHSEYLKFMNNYNAQEIACDTFKYAYPIIIVRKNVENSIQVGDISNERDHDYLPVHKGGYLDVTENFKYPAICVLVPNYRNLENSRLNLMLDGRDKNLSTDTNDIQQAINFAKYSKERSFEMVK